MFGWTLVQLVAFAAHSDLYSYILLIPLISGFLIWINRAGLPAQSGPNHWLAALSFAAGACVFAVCKLAMWTGWIPERSDYLSAMTLSFLTFWLGGGFIFLGTKYLRAIAFPVAFLFLCVPSPESVKTGIEAFLQCTSAVAAAAMLSTTGMPVLRTGTYLQLPSFRLNVAPECSGIHSTLVLTIICFLVAYVLLKRPANRLLLILAVIPLGILRNGFRIFIIAQLCVHVGPQMIDSPIHRHGGPVFFLLSLIPLFLFVRYLRKRELKREGSMIGPLNNNYE